MHVSTVSEVVGDHGVARSQLWRAFAPKVSLPASYRLRDSCQGARSPQMGGKRSAAIGPGT